MRVLRKTNAPGREDKGELRTYYFFPNFDGFEIVITKVPPKHAQPLHGHRIINEAHYVIEGNIDVEEDGVLMSLEPGDAVLLDKGKLHTLHNNHKEEATILTIKQPKAIDKFFSKTEDSETVSEETLRTLLEQNWLHARHVEMERLHFINTYAIILAALIALTGVTGLVLSWPVVFMSAFVAFFSLLGIIVTYKLSAEFHNHLEKIESIVVALKAREYIGLPLDRTKKGKWKFVRFTIAIYLLFIIMMVCSIGVVAYFAKLNLWP
jgi:uncharacterized cupin superfamily protein